MIARWRLQHLAEQGVGRLVRKNLQAEEDQYTHLKEATT